MVFYSCEKCGKQFSQKGHYNKHINKKLPCVNETKLKEIIGVVVNEKLNEIKNNNKIDSFISKDLEETINTEIPTMTTKHNLGQYFTTHNELKEKVFEFILNTPSNILEPSMGQGDLITFITDKIPSITFDMYEIDTKIKLLDKIQKDKVIYGDFMTQTITKT